MLPTLLSLAPLVAAQDLRPPLTVDLDRGWRVTAFDEAGEVLRSDRTHLPAEVVAGAAAARFERRVSSPAELADVRAVLVFDAPWQIERVELDGEVLAPSRAEPGAFPLGTRLADLVAHDLAVRVSGAADGPLGLWAGAAIEFLPAFGVAREHERRVGPLAEWTWLDPATPELVVRAELLARGEEGGELALEAKLFNSAGLRVAADLQVGLEVGPNRRAPVTFRLAPKSPRRWTPGDRQGYELRLDAYRDGEVVDSRTTRLACARVERVDGAVVDRATGRRLRTARYELALPGYGRALTDAMVARDLEALAAAGFEAVEARGPFGPLAGARDFDAAALAAGLWPVAGASSDEPAVAVPADLPAVARGDGEAALAAHARAVARALADGAPALAAFDTERGAPGLFDERRRPKFAYHAVRAAAGLPTVYPATFWNAAPLRGPLDVYASGAEVELFVDGRSLGRRQVGADPRAPFAAVFEDVERGAGRLRAVTYDGGRVVAERTLAPPAPVASLLLSVERQGVPLGLPDLVLVHAIALDADGAVQAGFAEEVEFTFVGDVEPVGAARVRAEAGVASLVLRTVAAGSGSVAARASGLYAEPLVLAVAAPR